jgi:transcriptional regulator with GAF, ATPase, and Fis domain
VSFFLSKCRDNIGKTIDSVATTSMDTLVAYDWPGNIRELQNVIERAVILCSGDTLTVEEALGAPEVLRRGGDRSLKHDLEAVERSNILHALEESDWKVKGEGNAASRLGLKPSTLRSRMRKLEITKPRVPD